MKRYLVLCLLLSGALMFSNAQTKSIKKSPVLTESSPESVGMSSQRIARIDSMCAQSVQSGDLPGVVALISRNGKIVFWKAYGMADNQANRALKRDDIFRIASQTKAITSTAVMMLWEEGKFQLDDPISKYIPEFKNPKVLKTYRYSDTTYNAAPAKSEITIRHLLTHTSGIGYGMIDSDERMRMIYQKAGIIDAFTTKNVTIADNIKKLAKLPLHHEPGEKFTYGESIDVLGYFIEILSGMPFDEFLKTHIFDPLGMNDTRFYQPESKAGKLVTVQQKNKDGEWERMIANAQFDPDYPIKGAKTFFAGGAGLSSTAKDYATFLQMYINGGEYNGVRLLSRTTVDLIMADHNLKVWDKNADYHLGLAFSVENQGGQDKGAKGSIGTFGWGGYFNTQYFADPKEKVIGIIMKQTQGQVNDDTGWKFRQMIWQTIDD